MATDNWVKPRNNGQHLLASELYRIKQAILQKRTAKEIAVELRCSTRTVHKWTRILNGNFAPPVPRKKALTQKIKTLPPQPRKTRAFIKRHYTSDFEPS